MVSVSSHGNFPIKRRRNFIFIFRKQTFKFLCRYETRLLFSATHLFYDRAVKKKRKSRDSPLAHFCLFTVRALNYFCRVFSVEKQKLDQCRSKFSVHVNKNRRNSNHERGSDRRAKNRPEKKAKSQSTACDYTPKIT